MQKRVKRLLVAGAVFLTSFLALLAEESAAATAATSAGDYCSWIYWCADDCDAELCDQYEYCDGACTPGQCGTNPDGPEYNYCFPDIE